MYKELTETTLLESRALAFIKAVQDRQSPEDVLQFYHPDIEHTEFPNAVTKHKTVRDLQGLSMASASGKNLMAKELYTVKGIYSNGNTVVVETEWTGTLAIQLGNMKAGDEIKAYFAQFFEFKDDKIYRQRNYDCFEPFG